MVIPAVLVHVRRQILGLLTTNSPYGVHLYHRKEALRRHHKLTSKLLKFSCNDKTSATLRRVGDAKCDTVMSGIVF